MAAPTFYNLIIYSNDGTTVLSSYSNAAQTITVTDTGCTGYTYSGSKKFLGFATSPNATTPIYAIGDTFSFSADTELYIVEEEVALAATITYNGNVIASLEAGQIATLACAGKKMKGDIVITYVGETAMEATVTITNSSNSRSALEVQLEGASANIDTIGIGETKELTYPVGSVVSLNFASMGSMVMPIIDITSVTGDVTTTVVGTSVPALSINGNGSVTVLIFDGD